MDCATTGCGEGEVCVGGFCVPDDCAHIACPPGEVCGADLNCYPEDCGGQTCGEYEACVNDTCVDRMCVGITPARCARRAIATARTAAHPARPGRYARTECASRWSAPAGGAAPRWTAPSTTSATPRNATA
jgi:hypothetical protein